MYDNGATEVVREMNGEQIKWKGVSRSGREYVRFGQVNPVIPFVDWESSTKRSIGEVVSNNHDLWPLKVGNKAEIHTKQRITKLDGTYPIELKRTWKCSVNETATVTVEAGKFDTFVIACRRSSLGRYGPVLRTERRYYYAPSVGHYVLYEDDHVRRPLRRKSLVRYGFNSRYLSREDRLTLNKALQGALNQLDDGDHAIWMSASENIQVTLKPVRSFVVADEKCREYGSVYDINGYMRRNVREMCKDGQSGLWKRIK